MPLTDDQRQTIRDEEVFRDEVRRELSSLGGKKPSPGLLGRLSAFFESKLGYWLLTTVVASVSVTGFTALQNALNREEIKKQQAATRSRTDMETLLKLGPMLTSDNLTQINMAIILLTSLVDSGGVNDGIGKPVKKLFEDAMAKGQRPDATPAERNTSNAIASYIDSARIDTIRQADASSTAPAPIAPTTTTPSPLMQSLDQKALPARVYLQIGREAERGVATAAQQALREDGLIAPDIELVGAQRAPAHNDLRYCASRVDEAMLARVQQAVARAIRPKPTPVPLPERLCTKVRYNHFEVWFALQAT